MRQRSNASWPIMKLERPCKTSTAVERGTRCELGRDALHEATDVIECGAFCLLG